jgi:hypothetical protein
MAIERLASSGSCTLKRKVIVAQGCGKYSSKS